MDKRDLYNFLKSLGGWAFTRTKSSVQENDVRFHRTFHENIIPMSDDCFPIYTDADKNSIFATASLKRWSVTVL